MKRPIAISLSPNTEKDDVLLALKLLFSPIRWFDVGKTKKLESEFANYFGKKYKAIAVNSGRSAEYLILNTLGLKPGDEVAMQSFTCVAVPNSAIWLGIKPVYIDIDKSFNLNPKDLSEKLSENTKAIIVQHAFGIPANFDVIKNIARRKKIPIIEDCAVSLGAKYKRKKVGTLGDISFFSFGRDKIISSVFGGMILCKDEKLYWKLKEERAKLDYPPPFWVIQQLIHPIAFSVILPLYNLGFKKLTLGKVLLFTLQKLGFLSRPVYGVEKYSNRPNIFPKKMPGALAMLVTKQFKKLDRFNKHRTKIAKFYNSELKKLRLKLPINTSGSVWLRYPILLNNRDRVFSYAKTHGVLLGDWYKSTVYPSIDLRAAGYIKGSCPNAEESTKKIINLPTYPTMELKDAKEVVRLIKHAAHKR